MPVGGGCERFTKRERGGEIQTETDTKTETETEAERDRETGRGGQAERQSDHSVPGRVNTMPSLYFPRMKSLVN